MRKAATLLGLVVLTLATVSAVSAMSPSSAQADGPRYTVLQMNLCLSGQAGCYPRTSYPSIVDEAAARVVDRDAEAVTLNEACSGDAARIARRTGYQMRFAAVLFGGEPLACVDPRGRGVFGIAVLTRDGITTAHDEAFAIHAGAEQRRWMCVTTDRPVTVCTAHLSTPEPGAARRANEAECRELRRVLARYDAVTTTVFAGDVNRQVPCAPPTMWATGDTSATQAAGIQHMYGSTSLTEPTSRVVPATYTDHDFFLTASRLARGPRRVSVSRRRSRCRCVAAARRRTCCSACAA